MALDQVSFSVAPGEFVSIVGHSGAGKTTLVKMLCGRAPDGSGAVFLNPLTHTLNKGASPITPAHRHCVSGFSASAEQDRL